MQKNDVIDWHTKIAENFDKKYSNSKYFKERFVTLTNILDKYSKQDFSVLDLGCGSGVFTYYLAEKNKKVVGIDASSEMLKICNKKKSELRVTNVDFYCANIDSLGKDIKEKADMVVCSSVLEYVDSLDEAFLTIANTMNQNGLFIFSIPNKQSLFRKIEPICFNMFGRPRYYKYVNNVNSISEIRIKLSEYGFDIIKSEYFGKIPYLSYFFRLIGLSNYSDNLFIVVARFSK